MAPQTPRGGHHAGRRSATGRHHRDSRNANTGAGVNRRGSRVPRGHPRPDHRGGRVRNAVTPGARLVDRMTTGDTRRVDRMTGGGVRLADRVTGRDSQQQQQQQRLVDRMSGGAVHRMAGGGTSQRFPRISAGYDRVRGLQQQQGRDAGGGSAVAPARSVQSRGLAYGQTDGPVDLTDNNANENSNNNYEDDDDWDLDLEVKPPTSNPHSNSTSTSQPPTIFSLAASPPPSRPPIRMFNQPQSSLPNYQFVAPRPVLHNGNTYRGNDPIKKLVQNRKLQAILADKPLPKERKVSKEEQLLLKM